MSKKKVYMVSLDTSTNHTGWGLYENGILIEHSLIDKSKVTPVNLKMDQMILSIFELLNKYKPIIVAIEETSAPRNAHTQRVLTEILGTVYGWCLCNDSEFVSMPPNLWRPLVYGKNPPNRDTAKKWAVEKVYEMYGIKVTDDEAEGILVGQARINQFKKITGEI